MRSAVVGLPYVGKTTLFNLLTGARAATGTFAGAEAAANVGVAKVPDELVERLAELFRPKRTVHAEVQYTDVGLARGAGRGEGIAGKHLAELRDADALAHVVRAFRDPTVPLVEGELPDPARDASTLELELLVADLGVAERRLQRLEPELRSARAVDREAREQEFALGRRVHEALAAGTPVRDLPLEAEERKALRGFRFLSEKPQLVVVNLDESDLGRAAEVTREVNAAVHRATAVTTVCAKIEAEIAELPPDEAMAFRRELGLAEPPLDRIVRETYALLGLVSFFTIDGNECRAWTIPAGSTALDAAGLVHSDMARGFIRAEVIRWDELLACGGLAEARAKGVLRTEGRGYVVQDGDVLHVLFNV